MNGEIYIITSYQICGNYAHGNLNGDVSLVWGEGGGGACF